MDFKLANKMADRIAQGDDTCSLSELVSVCMQYLLYMRSRFGFRIIPTAEVVNELAADAVSDAIIIKRRRNLPFSICLQNTFRDCCRQRMRFLRKHTLEDILDRCEIRDRSSVIGIGPEYPSAEIQILDEEKKRLLRHELDRHEPFSKKLVYQRLRGSTIDEMAHIFDEPFNECKRVYWHDFTKIRDKLRRQYSD